MIKREYPSNINVRAPKSYFENWYAAMWRRNFQYANNVQPHGFWKAIKNDLAEVGAIIIQDDDSAYWTVEFERDEDYTFFVLRWS